MTSHCAMPNARTEKPELDCLNISFRCIEVFVDGLPIRTFNLKYICLHLCHLF
jgi:hypothetical protein